MLTLRLFEVEYHFKVISRIFQGCLKGISRLFQAHFKVVAGSFQVQFKGISRSFQGHFKIISIKVISRLFQDHL